MRPFFNGANWPRGRAFWRGSGSGSSFFDDTAPVQAELLSVERLEEHARSLAAAQTVVAGPSRGKPLERRLADNEAVLLAAYRAIVAAINENAAITPAAEWLVDNYHVIERQVREVRQDLPPGFYRQLPKLAGGPFADYPRVFGLGWAFVAHTDSLFDPEVLRRFLRAYQDVQPLTIGELWAVAITLKIVLLENLRRLAARITTSRADRREADILADRLLGVAGRQAEPVDTLLATCGVGPFSEAFLVQLVHRLRDQERNVAPALEWLEARLAAQATTGEDVVRREHQRQVSASVTVRNIITSMRLISDVDWGELFERVSMVDDRLSAASRFAEMDFPTRNLYRSAIEEIARGSGQSELDVAAAALRMAQTVRPGAGPGDERESDPGYYLIADGRRQFETAIGFRPTLSAWPARFYKSLGIGGYVSAGSVVAATLLAAVLAALGTGTTWLVALGLFGLVPAIGFSIALVNYVLTRAFRATLLPAMDLKAGIPEHLRTLIAVPMMLTSREEIEDQIERLEVHYLASPDGKLHFALLSDWADADQEHAEGDDELLSAATAGIAELNSRYGREGGDTPFFLFHRKRVWNQGEDRWIGWERKRGKLSELNRLLRGSTQTSFLDLGGQAPAVPAGIRYVITLDSDTRLPRTTVERLIGKMAHPLNRPLFDASRGRVVEGYGVLQPRITPALPGGRGGSLYLRVFSSATGIDPYAAAVSDVYQDLFGEGTYTGKGIYDIDAFEASLDGRVPESSLLSHDLFEGVFARAGLASDAEVVEDFPDRYDTAAQRQHRWARGDWQLLPWILWRGPRIDGRRRGIPAIGRFKMLDNLRRSAAPPTMVLSLVAGLCLPLQPSILWVAFILTTLLLPPLFPVFAALRPPREDVSFRSHFGALRADVRLALFQMALLVVFLAHQAWLMADAILRTLIRLGITRRHLLEWTPAAQAAMSSRPTLAGWYRKMAGALVIAVATMIAALIWGEGTWPIAAAFATLWCLSPVAALWVSRPPGLASDARLSKAETTTLRLIGRRTWRFFETFVTPADNMLPPDNFQETPEPAVAHRTSPTNMGLYLLSVACARDFGWIGTVEAVDRLDVTMATLAKLPRYRGHFYNWYDTQDLRSLDPQYVSSVDSGNLAGHLIALANSCNQWAQEEIGAAGRLDGIGDAFDLCRQEAQLMDISGPGSSALMRQLAQNFRVFSRALRAARVSGSGALGDQLDELSKLGQLIHDTAHALAIDDLGNGTDLRFWADALQASIESHRRDISTPAADGLDARLRGLENSARAMALAMEFDFLLDPDRLLLSIGYKTLEGALDQSSYDLLASEARLASFLAIAKGDAPARHWFRLGHAVTTVQGAAALISWSGSMFEYLMPTLVMKEPRSSLLEQTNRLIVGRQIKYGELLKMPWGISESAYNARDVELTYQYSNFGIPGLGLKRGLADNAVVAPYATALAAMIEPQAAVRNFARMADVGGRGRYGFYEALDYTPSRVPDGETLAVVRTYMAHHQGMTIVAIANTLMGGVMRDRFHAEPIVQATELLLQERAPRDVRTAPPYLGKSALAQTMRHVGSAGSWRVANPDGAIPATQLLSNGRYTVMLTAAGSGYSAWRDIAVTRWREDPTCDDHGSFIYLRDSLNGDIFSPTLQPTGMPCPSASVSFNEDHAEFANRNGDLTTTLEILVSAEDDAEVRRVTLSNGGSSVREIEITSYAELVLAPQSADVAHPAFSKLFVETEHLAGLGALLASRRRRSLSDPEIWAAHLVVVDGELVGQREFETDRARFLGRGNTARTANAIFDQRPLSGTVGAVLDPVFALRRRVRLAPGSAARIDFWTMAASSRAEIVKLVDKHHDTGAFARAAALAWTQAQVQLHHLGISREDAGEFQRLASRLLYAGASMRPASDTISEGRAGQPELWPLAISGDLPILLVRVSEMEHLGLVHQALQAVEYMRLKGLAVDLVILNERSSSYTQDLQIALETLVSANQSRPRIVEQRPDGHIFILRADLIAPKARAMLLSTARAVLVGEGGRLLDQLRRTPNVRAADRSPAPRAPAISELQVISRPQGVEFFNGLGGFVDNGREYVIIMGPGQTTPAPWINVIANPDFGFQVSAEGGGYTWSQNSRERQITPWSNDPVTDRPGQAFYLRDEDTNEIWSPTALPIWSAGATYIAHHGWGYSRFELAAHGLAVELLEYVPVADPVRISRLTIRNTSDRKRRISVTAYIEWALGPSRAAVAPFVITQIDPDTRAMYAQTAWYPAFADRVAFADLGGRQTSWTGDRREFIGRNGSLAAPAALAGATGDLSGKVGSGLDPCGALQTTIELAPGQSDEIVLFLGDANDADHARRLIETYRTADLDAVLLEVRTHWLDLVEAVQVKTPDRSMDIMLNGWLLYQTLASRIWARSGFYQASGAYGFRDQLQDGMALAAARPDLTRQHLVRAAGRQFREGDVQHWWLPHSGQGVRTRISDDRAWLAYTAAHYVSVTGDRAVLDEAIPFLEGPALEPDEADRFFQPDTSVESASLYEHCALALDASLSTGRHGLPLMGSGDWNDGMNRVGEGGAGESVWLGWLLHSALKSFLPLAAARHDDERVARWETHAEALKASLDREGWDGSWYRRAWYDDGTPLGSAASEECRIDSIAQSWAVLSAAAPIERARTAMASVDRALILSDAKLALLFTPPFDQTPLDPGYIKGYPPGVRENGGQYTHAALWSVMAFAALGEGEKAAALFYILNPVNHARTRSDVHRYKVEPYAVAADVYAAPAHVGRGGWSWYTGSAGWMQRAGVESILGLRILDGWLHVDPCIPAAWPRFEATLRYRTARYEIQVENPSGVATGVIEAELDGVPVTTRPPTLCLNDDGAVHRLTVRLG